MVIRASSRTPCQRTSPLVSQSLHHAKLSRWAWRLGQVFGGRLRGRWTAGRRTQCFISGTFAAGPWGLALGPPPPASSRRLPGASPGLRYARSGSRLHRSGTPTGGLTRKQAARCDSERFQGLRIRAAALDVPGSCGLPEETIVTAPHCRLRQARRLLGVPLLAAYAS